MIKRSLLLLSGIVALTACGGRVAMDNVAVDNALSPAQKEARLFSPEVMLKMARLGAPLLSADGSQVLYTINHQSVADNKGYTSIWVQPLVDQGDTPHPAHRLTGNNIGANSPVWGPADPQTGRQPVYFLSSKSGSSQLWRVQTDGRGLQKMSDIAGGIDGFGISPDGRKIWYAAQVKVEPVTGAERYGDRAAKSQVRIYDDLMERHWDTWEDGAYSHIFVADFDPDKGVYNSKDIMPQEAWDAPLAPYFDMAEISWCPSSLYLVYTCKKQTGYAYAMSTDSDIYWYSLAEGTTTNLTAGMPGYDKYPLFSPDGSFLAWQSMARAGNEADKDRLMLRNMQTAEVMELTAGFDYNAENLRWSHNSHMIYFLSPVNGRYVLCSVNARPGAQVQIEAAGDWDYTAFDLSYRDGKLVFVAAKTTLSMATELFRVYPGGGDLAGGKPTKPLDEQITFANQEIYDNVDMGQVRERWVTTSDGKQMLVWVTLPPNFDPNKQYPTLLYCQGGPQSVVSQRWSYRWNFQAMAAQGYVVVAPNRRGLPSFGQQWLDQISGDYSGQNIRDYLWAIDDVAREPWVDRERMGCVGASYGGYSTFYLMGHHQNRFKAFIAHCGMFNFESFYGETEELWFPTRDLGGAYWDRPFNRVADRSYLNSPHRAVNAWNTPILIITGAYDFRIPYTQSLQAFTAARAKGLDARLVFFEDEAHQVFRPQNALVWHREFFGWLDKYLK